ARSLTGLRTSKSWHQPPVSEPPAHFPAAHENYAPAGTRSIALRRSDPRLGPGFGPPGGLIRHVRAQFLQPRGRGGVARRAPVAAGAEGAGGRNLGAIGARAALELAEGEEALDEA